MKKNSILLIAVFLLTSASVFAQQWVKIQNGSGNGDDVITAVAPDNNGNVYVTGFSYTSTHGMDYRTIKYNSNGVPLWQRYYNGPGNGDDFPRAIFVDADGFAYVTGMSDAYPSYGLDNDVATVKYSPQGAEMWVARYDGNIIREDAGNAIKVDGSGNVYVAGYTTVHTLGYSAPDYLTLKYNSSGVQQWAALHDGPGNAGDVAVGLGLDAQGNVYVTGTDFAGNDPLGEGDMVTIKYNPAGTEQWLARFNGASSESDGAVGIAVDADGNSYITGSSRIGGINTDYVTIKYNSNGDQLWLSSYGGAAGQGDIPAAIALDPSGNVYVTGTDQKIPYWYDYLTIKYNNDGQQQWTARFDGKGQGNDWPTSMDVDASGNVYVTGQSIGLSYTWDIATVKYNTSGVKQWARTYDGPAHGDDIGYSVKADANGNVYVGGSVTVGNLNYVTIKYNSNGHKEAVPVADNKVNLKAYPNPCNTSTTITYTVVQGGNVSFIVQDINGNVIREWNNGNMQPGTYSFNFSAAALPSGMYVCEMLDEDLVSETKLVVVR